MDALLYEPLKDQTVQCQLYHFYPGTLAYSVGTVGCNFKCRFCQNADIAQMPSDQNGRVAGRLFTPADIVTGTINGNCQSIAYTYTEPTVFFELALAAAKLAHAENIKNLFVSNGYMTAEALELISPYQCPDCGAKIDGVGL